jgi:hypothetical protein
VLNDRILSTFPSTPIASLPQLCEALIHQQQSSWPQLANGYASLKEVRVREVMCEGYSVFVQFNPERMVSTGAKVDPKSISERKCFLCAENLPPEEQGILYRDEFLILCNPWPILEKHMTIAHIRHLPQGIEGYVPVFLELARAMAPAFSVLYNGPKCGASAPDHRHFQAGPIGTLPIENDAADPARRELRLTVAGTVLFSLKNVGRQVLVIEGNHATRVEALFSRLLAAMRQFLATEEEPKVNLLCSHSGGMWRLIVFPRQKHRPEAFFMTGDEQVLLSPATTDVGGVVVTPVEKNFNDLDARMIQNIFDEVMLDKDTVDQIIAAV